MFLFPITLSNDINKYSLLLVGLKKRIKIQKLAKAGTLFMHYK